MKTKSSRPVMVGTVKESIDAVAETTDAIPVHSAARQVGHAYALF